MTVRGELGWPTYAVLVSWCLLFLFVIAGAVRQARAQEVDKGEIAPYEFARVERVTIYKAVHEGCELFIARARSATGTADSVAIATGRGCK